MASSYLPAKGMNDWEGPEPASKNVRLRGEAVKHFPTEIGDFEVWIAQLCAALDENGLKHHLGMDDDLKVEGPTANEVKAEEHADGSPMPYDPKNLRDVKKYCADQISHRKLNRIKVFAYIKGKCSDGTDAGYLAEEEGVYGKPRTLLLRIKGLYVVIDKNDLNDWEEKLERFTMTKGEAVDSIKQRLEAILRELAKLEVIVNDELKRKRFMGALTDTPWDKPVFDELENHPTRGKMTGRTFMDSYLYMRTAERDRKARAERRPPGTNADKVYSLSQIPDNQKNKLMLALMKQQGVTPATVAAVVPGAQPGNATGGKQGFIAKKKAAYAAKMAGRKPKAQKLHQPPPRECFTCGQGSPAHMAYQCPLKSLPPNQAGKAAKQAWEDYKKKCDTANEVYCFEQVAVILPVISNPKEENPKPPKVPAIPINCPCAHCAQCEKNQPPESGNRGRAEEISLAQIKTRKIACDSGATKGVEADLNDLDNARTLVGQTAMAANDAVMLIPNEGDVSYAERMVVKGVLHCPEVRRSLQSVSQTATQLGISVHMDDSRLVWHKKKIKIPPEDIIATGTLEAGMYLLDPETDYDVSSRNLNCDEIQQIRGKLAIREPNLICEMIGIYSFETGNGVIREQLAISELGERPIPRPIVKKRKKERWDPMREFGNNLALLHKRWAHKSGLRRTIRFQGCRGLPLKYSDLKDKDCICEACLMAKMSKCIHSPVFRRLWLIGQLLHFDEQQKPVRSWNGKHHTLMAVEHVAKYVKPYFLALKSDAYEFCLAFIAWVERRTGNKVLAIQCDGGGEFTGELHRYCVKNGIGFQKTSRANPEENGVAEAYNKVNHQTAEAMKWQAGMADKFWPERETHGCLIDTYTVKAGRSVTAHEMILNQQPSCELIRVFGCHGFAFVSDEDARRVNKTKAHMRPGIYMGVSELMNGYNLYDPVEMKFFEASTAVFDEFAVGFAALIERVSGPPTTIPKEWIEKLNEEWREKYKDSELTKALQSEQEGPRTGTRTRKDEEEVTTPLERIDPDSPLLEWRHEEVSTGELPKQPTPITRATPESEMRSTPKPMLSGRVSCSTKRVVTTPPQAKRKLEFSTPVLELPEPNRPVTPPLTIPIKGIARMDEYVPPQVEPKPAERKERNPKEKWEGTRRSERHANKFPTYYGSVQNAYYDVIHRKQEEIMHIMDSHSKPNEILKDAQYILAVQDDSISLSTPRSFRQAKSCAECKHWWEAMDREMTAHKVNGTWRLVPRPEANQGGKKHVIVMGIWKYRIKTQQNEITSYKARLCADGRFVDAEPHEVFAGTPVQDMVYLVFALAAHFNVGVIAGDVPAAYVQAPMPDGDTVYYLLQPPGFEDKEKSSWVCQLLKCLYGLPQSGHQWCEEFATFLVSIGMTRLVCDPAAFYMRDDDGFMLLVVTVDDTIDVCTSPKMRKKIHDALVEKFRWKNIGVCEWHLGMRVQQSMDDITIDQTAYLTTILERFDRFNIVGCDTPMRQVPPAPEDGVPMTDFPYQCILGCLIWMTKTRFDISYAVSTLAQYMRDHTEAQDKALLQVLGYLKKHPNWGVGFKMNTGETDAPLKVSLATDSSWADCVPTRESSVCYMSFIGGCCFQCKSSKTPNVCHDVHEAEYHAFFKGGGQFKYLSQVFYELGIKIERPVPIRLDSASAIKTLSSWKITQRSKHIDMRCHSSRELVVNGEIEPVKVATELNEADLGTKPYAPFALKQMRPKVMSRIRG
jgi:hypothetical protein